MKRAIFLDRDGTIIEDRGNLKSPDEVVFFPDTVSVLNGLKKHFLFFIVTHQSGIAKGLLTEEEVESVNNYVVQYLADAGITIERVYCCPHNREDGCECIKPNPFHLLQAAEDFNIDLEKSFVLGDHPHDVELGNRSGAKGIYLLTGHGRNHLHELPSSYTVMSGIREAGDFIKTQLS